MKAGLRYGQEAIDNGDGTTTVSGKCQLKGHPHSIVVPTEGLERWREGAYVQVAMPDVHPGDREFLISGSCNKCFDEMFGRTDE